MERQILARAVVGLAVAVGVLVEILFYGLAPGINLTIAASGLLVSAVLVRPPAARFDRLDAWLPGSALVLAAFVAVRADATLVVVDTLAVLVLLAASMPAIAGIPVTRRTTEAALALAAVCGASLVAGASVAARELRWEVRGDALQGARIRTAPVLRGLLIALPVVLAFVILFASADLVFNRWLENLAAVEPDLGDRPARLLVVIGAAWFAAGALWLAGDGRPPGRGLPPASLGAAAALDTVERRSDSSGLGTTEAITVLVAVDVVFGQFVALQVAYLFGGLDTLAAAGTTYAEYARRGFFELLFAAALACSLVGMLDGIVVGRTRRYVGASLVLLGLTAIVLLSAVMRLRLYQEAYGWTELRFWALAGIVFVGIALAVTAILVGRARTDRLPHALGALLIAVLVGMNVVGPRAFVADRNLERVLNPSLIPPDGEQTVDIRYLIALGDDAVPSLVAALPWLAEPDRARVRAALDARSDELGADPALTGWPAWNLGRERAREALRSLPR
jgi:hypothetical protein